MCNPQMRFLSPAQWIQHNEAVVTQEENLSLSFLPCGVNRGQLWHSVQEKSYLHLNALSRWS